jgi:hypothetical protein
MVDKKNMIVGAFYIGGHYEVCGAKLKNDCEKHGYEYDIFQPDDLKEFCDKKMKGVTMRNWICRYKPQFIRDMLDKHKKPVLYLDVDCSIIKKIDTKVFRGKKIGICHQDDNANKVIWDAMASCVYFYPCEEAYSFLNLWEYKCLHLHMDRADHYFLKTTLVDFQTFKEFGIGYLGKVFISKKKINDPFVLYNARKYRR